MKTNLMSRNAWFNVLFMILLFGTSNIISAQCPTIMQPASSIDDASGLLFADLDVIASATSDVIWYDSPTGGNVFNENQFVYQGTYYAGDASGSCGIRQPLIVDFTINPSGINLDRFFCSNNNPLFQDYITQVLQTGIPAGGSVEIYWDLGLTSLIMPTDAIPSGPADYFIIFLDSSGNKSQIEVGRVAVISAPADPTPLAIQEFCTDLGPITIGDLDPGTAAVVNWYNTINASGTPISPFTPLVDGNTYYVQIAGFCGSNLVPVQVIIDDPVDSGTASPAEFCESDLATNPILDLFSQLTGQDSGGTWTDDNTTGALSVNNVDLTLLPIGASSFSYTVLSNSACLDATSTVTITIFESFTSGVQSTLNPATFCEKDLPTSFDLSTLLTGQDPNGQWTQGTLSTDPIITSPIDLTGLLPNTYNFTYTQNLLPNSCPEESTTVQVVILEDPDAGIAVNQTFCESDLIGNSPFDLFNALDGSQDNNLGVWTDAGNNTVSNPIDITSFTVIDSPYQFTYTISNGVCEDTETISITISQALTSGTISSLNPATFCEKDLPTSFDLSTLLTGQDPNGQWTQGTLSTDPIITSPIDLTGLLPNTYNFTYTQNLLPNSCPEESTTVQVVILEDPDAGIAVNQTFCESDLIGNSPFDLFNALDGSQDNNLGVWTDAGNNTVSNPIDITSFTVIDSPYQFTYTISNGVCEDIEIISITIIEAPESGTPNPPAEFCIAEIATGQTYDLFDLLEGEDQTGTWSDDDNSLALTGNIVALDGLAQGTYNFTYDVDAILSCDDVNVTVSIIINDIPEPTVISSTQEFCDTATVADLVATGNSIEWYADATGGAPLTATSALINGETYYATQIDATTGCESSTRTEVTAIIFQTPTAGALATTSITTCNNVSIDLNSGLDGTQDSGGTWYEGPDNTGALVVNPTMYDVTGLSASTYEFTYYVTASAPCVDDSITITITIEEPLNAGTNNVLDVCSNNGTTDLFTLIGSADMGGTWSPSLTSGTGVFDPLVDAQGTYTYTLTNTCGIFSSEVEVSVSQAPNAGVDNAVLICVIDGVTDLFTFLGTSAQSGGTWSPALPSGTGAFNPSTDAEGVYTYTVTAVAPCTTDATAQITVTIDDSNAPTVNEANPEFCAIDNPTVSNLDAFLSIIGTVVWYEDVGLTIVANATDNLIDGEDYYATQTNSSGCESSISTPSITVTINDAPTPIILTSNQELCISDDPTISELTSNIDFNSSVYNVAWYDSDVNGSVISETSLLEVGETYYAVLIDLVTGCESSVRLEVTPDLTSCGELIIPDGFSPNGDGVNDTFDVGNLAILYPNFEIEIYNRYGNMVYKGNANTQRFDGTSNQSGVLSNGNLPVGVYFYIFKFNDDENEPEQGRLYLSR